MLRKTERASRDMLQAREKSGIMWGFPVRKQETWLPQTKSRLRFAITPMPQSSIASAPGMPARPNKASQGPGEGRP